MPIVSALPALPAPVLPVLVLAAGALAVLDAGLRFRRPGGVALIAVLELVAGLLVLVHAVPAVHPWVTTTLPVVWLTGAVAVLALLQLVVKAARRGGRTWLAVVVLVVAVLAAVLSYLG